MPPLPPELDAAYTKVVRYLAAAKHAKGDDTTGEHASYWGDIHTALGELHYQIEAALKDFDALRIASSLVCRELIDASFEVPSTDETDETAIDPLEAEMARAWDARHAAITADFHGGSNA